MDGHYLNKKDVKADLLIRSIRYAIERNRADAALRESEERYALAVEGANDGIWDWHLSRNVMYYSSRWKSMLGYGRHDIGTDIDAWFDRVHQDDLNALRTALCEHVDGLTEHFEHEHRIRTKDGEHLWVLSRGLAVRDDAGIAYRMAGSLTDITARKQAEEQLLHDAMHDSLTGLPNRALFLDRLDQALKQARRQDNHLFAVLFFDLDRFKNVNDSLGHGIGDELLIAIARRLESSLRPGDTLARHGGDEFAVLLNSIDNVGDATQVAERIHQLFAKEFIIWDHEVYTSASIGIVIGSNEYERPEDMLRDADLAMYRAKAGGHARYEIFDSAMHHLVVELLKLETELRRAVDRHEFVLFYQPIVCVTTKCIIGFEALVRWNHPTRGLVGPGHFILSAEELGLTVPIGWCVIEKACAQTRKWQEQFPTDPLLTINQCEYLRQAVPAGGYGGKPVGYSRPDSTAILQPAPGNHGECHHRSR